MVYLVCFHTTLSDNRAFHLCSKIKILLKIIEIENHMRLNKNNILQDVSSTVEIL